MSRTSRTGSSPSSGAKTRPCSGPLALPWVDVRSMNGGSPFEPWSDRVYFVTHDSKKVALAHARPFAWGDVTLCGMLRPHLNLLHQRFPYTVAGFSRFTTVSIALPSADHHPSANTPITRPKGAGMTRRRPRPVARRRRPIHGPPSGPVARDRHPPARARDVLPVTGCRESGTRGRRPSLPSEVRRPIHHCLRRPRRQRRGRGHSDRRDLDRRRKAGLGADRRTDRWSR